MALALTLLGTGSPAPLIHRAGSSYLVELAGEKLLFDCGPGAVRRLLEFGVAPTAISGLFLTHLHYDHCVDYAYFNLLCAGTRAWGGFQNWRSGVRLRLRG